MEKDCRGGPRVGIARCRIRRSDQGVCRKGHARAGPRPGRVGTPKPEPLAALGSLEVGDDETGPDDDEDVNGSDDGEDSDGWGNKALIGGGIAAATIGGVLLFTGGKKAGPVVSMRRGGVAVRQTVRF